jgi:hypothetical protein
VEAAFQLSLKQGAPSAVNKFATRPSELPLALVIFAQSVDQDKVVQHAGHVECHTVRGREAKSKSSRVQDYIRGKSLVLVL